MKRILWPATWLSLFFCLSGAALASERSVHTFFEGTQYPLTAYYLTGDQPGPTVMVQGGIQGDEASGYVTAQLLARAEVRKGRLIIVPRANVPSVHIRRRQVNVDLNRRFDRDYNQYYEDRLARAIRFLLQSCDAFIHLHEGSGFYNPTYVDNLRNPRRYGQSIIIDTKQWGESIDLAETVRAALLEINPHVDPDRYRFQLFNTKTFDEDSPYPEMRKSLTCYALKRLGIPALAIEVSKNISNLGWKVKQQMAATTVMLRRLGVEIIPPEIDEAEVRGYAAKGVRVKVNGRSLDRDREFSLPRGSILSVSGESETDPRFSPALCVFASDRPGVNLLTAPRMALEPFKVLEVRADGHRVSRFKVNWNGKWPDVGDKASTTFVCWLNNAPVFVEAGGTLQAVEGDQMLMEGVWGGRRSEILNMKGFVSDPAHNDGQDAGREIILAPDSFMSKYLGRGENGEHRVRVMRETPGQKRESFFVNVAEREVRSLVVRDRLGRRLSLPWIPGGTVHLPPGAYVLEDAEGNGSREMVAAALDGTPLGWGEEFTLGLDAGRDLTLRQATTFLSLGSMTVSHGSMAEREWAGPYRRAR